MSDRRLRSHAENDSMGSSQGSTWRERRHKRCEDREREREEEQSGLGEGSYQTHRTISSASRHKKFDERDEELERLRRLVRDLELKVRGRHQRRDQDDRERRVDNGGNQYRVESNQSSSCRRWDRSQSSPIKVETVHVHASIPIGIQTPQRGAWM